MLDLVGKTIKAVHTDYAWKRPCPWLIDDQVAHIIGVTFEKIEGVWHRHESAEVVLEFTDDTKCAFEAGYYGDPIELELI